MTNRATAGLLNRLGTKLRIFSACAGVILLAPPETIAQAGPDSAQHGPQKARAGSAPAGFLNCGPRGVDGAWGAGAVYADASALASKSLQSVASAWCGYLGNGLFGESDDFVAQWSDAQLTENLMLDLGMEWARSNMSGTRIRFRVVQTDTTNKERFIVTTTLESATAAEWRTRATHTVAAYVYKDTARFESSLSPRLSFASRWIAAPLQFVRLDTGAVDTTRANAAAAFVKDMRLRLGIESPPYQQVSYFYSKSGKGHEFLGFSEFDGVIDGFTNTSPRFVLSNVAAAGEFNRNELVRVALMAHAPRLSNTFEQSLAKVLGGYQNRTWSQFVCEGRSTILDTEKVADIPSFLAKPDSLYQNVRMNEWDNAFFIDYLIAKSGDAGLRALMGRDRDFSTRAGARAAVAAVMEITPDVLSQRVAEYNATAELLKRCSKK